AGRCVVVGDGSAICLGSVSRSLGILAAAMRRWESASAHFEDALTTHARMGARPWLAHTQHNYATMLLDRSEPGDHARALELLKAAIHTARELGMQTLLERALTLELAAQGAAGTGAEQADRSPTDAARLQHEGDYWTLVHSGVARRLKDSKGLHYLV